jgi:hypothetical protein
MRIGPRLPIAIALGAMLVLIVVVSATLASGDDMPRVARAIYVEPSVEPTPATGSIAPSDARSADGATYFGTAPSGGSQLPRDDASCALLVSPTPREPRADNSRANGVAPPTGAVSWADTQAQTHWWRWIAKRGHVSGNYTGTTDQILRWGACKWAIDEDVIRAVAAQESSWHQSTVGDDGQSFGIMQVKDHYADGTPAWGGYPWTLNATAINVDFYAGVIRSCLDGDFYDGGSWLYNGQTIRQVIAQHGQGYALWGCVGSWFSGRWYDPAAVDYVKHVKSGLAKKTWRDY